jgi:DNA (cytosine-5)-methyltransferase 1
MSKRRSVEDQLPLVFQQEVELVSLPTVPNGCSIESRFRFVDLFAGIGGFHHALEPMGGECVLAVELDAECRRVYGASFPHMRSTQIQTDIRTLTRVSAAPDAEPLTDDEIRRRVPEHDVLCAGFPCQPFSKSGLQEGTRDRTRGTLFFDVMSIVLARTPEYVILENVRNLAGPRHEDTWQTIVDSLRDAGYRVADDPVVLSPHLLAQDDGGAPQVRERVFILARRLPAPARAALLHGEALASREPTPGWDPHDWDIREFLDPDVPLELYGLNEAERGWLDAWQAFVQGIREDSLPGFPIWVDDLVSHPRRSLAHPGWKVDFLEKNSDFYRRNKRFIDRWLTLRWGPQRDRVADFPASRRKFEWQARRAQPAAGDRDLEGLVVHFRPSGIRVKPRTYLPALVAITQTSVLGPKVSGTDWRRLTPREAAKLQGIPFDGFVRAGVADKTIYRQLGNAVNVGVVQHVARALFEDGGLQFFDVRNRALSVAG